MTKTYTVNQDFVVFHTSEAGRPEAYPVSGWTYEPIDWTTNEPYAPAYPSMDEALARANDWEYKQELENSGI